MSRRPLTRADRWRLWRERYRPFQRLLALALGLGVLGYGLSTLITESDVSAHRATAKAQVARVDRAGRGPDTITVAFQTPDGRRHQADIEDTGPKEGDAVEIEYDATNPSHARLKGSHGQLVAGIIFTPTGLFILIAGLVAPEWAFRRRR